MARIDDGQARLITRGGHDWSAKMPALVQGAEGSEARQRLARRRDRRAGRRTARRTSTRCRTPSTARAPTSIDYFLFDLPYFEGYDLRADAAGAAPPAAASSCSTTRARRALRFSADFDADAASILESARRMGLEGVIAKRNDAPYESRRTETWLKLKCKLRQEFVVAGYTDRSSGEAEIGSLLLACTTTPGSSCYVGSVGTGWDAQTAAALKKRLTKLESAASPFGAEPLRTGRWARARPGERALGRAAAGGRGRVRGLDARRPDPPRQVPRPARRQAGHRPCERESAVMPRRARRWRRRAAASSAASRSRTPSA